LIRLRNVFPFLFPYITSSYPIDVLGEMSFDFEIIELSVSSASLLPQLITCAYTHVCPMPHHPIGISPKQTTTNELKKPPILHPDQTPTTLPKLPSPPPNPHPLQPQMLERRTTRIKIQPLHAPITPPQTDIIKPRNRQPVSAVLVACAIGRRSGARVVVRGVDEAAFLPAHEDVFFVQSLEARFGEEEAGYICYCCCCFG